MQSHLGACVLHERTCRELIKQNEVLRHKEAMHLEALEISEAVLSKLGVVANQPAPGTKQHEKWLEAVLLDMLALNLKQELLLTPVAAAQQAVPGPLPGTVAPSAQAPSEPTCSRSTCSSNANSSSSGSGSNLHSNSQHSVDNRVMGVFATLTPEEIMQSKGLSVAEVAGEEGLGRACLLGPCVWSSACPLPLSLDVFVLRVAQEPSELSHPPIWGE